jgi:hypothetical protein
MLVGLALGAVVISPAPSEEEEEAAPFRPMREQAGELRSFPQGLPAFHCFFPFRWSRAPTTRYSKLPTLSKGFASMAGREIAGAKPAVAGLNSCVLEAVEEGCWRALSDSRLLLYGREEGEGRHYSSVVRLIHF